MEIFQLIFCILKPFLGRNRRILFFICHRCRLNELSVVRITGNADQVILICLIQQRHFFVQIFIFQILILDHTVIHRIGNPSHAAQIILQIDRCLLQQLAGVFLHQRLFFSGKLFIKQHAQKTQTAYRDDRKRQCDRHLYASCAHIFSGTLRYFSEPASDLIHVLLTSPLCISTGILHTAS